MMMMMADLAPRFFFHLNTLLSKLSTSISRNRKRERSFPRHPDLCEWPVSNRGGGAIHASPGFGALAARALGI